MTRSHRPRRSPWSAVGRAAGLLQILCLSVGPTLGSWSAAQAQAAPASVLDALRRLPTGAEPSETPAESGAASWALEHPVDPEQYQVLPGDLLHVGAWGDVARSFTLRVGPEGHLLLPNAGPLDVRGLTLRAAERRVIETLRPLYPRAEITLRLVEPGRFRVPVAGFVARPGVYEVTSFDRLASLLEQAGGIRAGGSLRRIRLHSDPAGAGQEVDVARWLIEADLEANPLLRPGHSIEVPAAGPTIRVRGPIDGRIALQAIPSAAARFADRPEEEPDLRVEIVPGDSVATALALTGGRSDRATGRASLAREGSAPRALDLASPVDRATALSPGDVLELEYAARWVYVTGSVRMPGRYPHLPGLRVGDYVSLAGGPTELGRLSGWTVRADDQDPREVEPGATVDAGSTLRIPERRTYKLQSWLAPISSATALVISLVALSRN